MRRYLILFVLSSSVMAFGSTRADVILNEYSAVSSGNFLDNGEGRDFDTRSHHRQRWQLV
jgi:hypothetical protein